MSSAGIEKRGSAATVRACDSCRRRKRRCLWAPGANSCNHCIQLKEECATTHIRKPRTRPQKRDRIAEYEQRIQNLETLLKERSTAQPQVQEQPLPPADHSVPLSIWVDNLRTEVDALPKDTPDVDPYSYEGSLQIIGKESAPAGSSTSGQSDSALENTLSSLDDIEPSADFQQDAALLQDPSFQPTLPLEDLTLTDTPLEQPVGKCDGYYLPPPELGASLLAEFLVDWNTVFPLYRPYAIAEHLRICYDGRSDGSALAWASAYVILGIAHRARGMSAVATPQDNQMADWYLTKTLPTVSGLLVTQPSLGLVQCLLALSMLIKTSPHLIPHSLFVTTALRLSQCLAYEHDEVENADPLQDVEQQRRVFWSAFILDTDEAILSNAPTTHRRGDITAKFPDENPQDSLGSVTAAEGDWKINIFSLRVRLACLQSEVIEQVLSKTNHQSLSQNASTAATKLLDCLQAWRDNALFQLSANELMQLLYRSDLCHVLSIEGSYFATVFRIHAASTLKTGSFANPFSADTLTTLAAQKEHGAYKDADRLLSLLSVTPHGDIGVCWMIKLPLVAALVTVLAYHVHTPSSAPSSDKLREYSQTLRTLGILVEKSGDLELLRARDLCMMLFSKLESGLRIKWLDEQVDKAK